MTMMSALYQTNTLSWILFNSGRHVAPIGHIIPIPSQPVFALTLQCSILSGEAIHTTFIVFNESRTHDIPHSRRACYPVHHRCGLHTNKGLAPRNNFSNHVCYLSITFRSFELFRHNYICYNTLKIRYGIIRTESRKAEHRQYNGKKLSMTNNGQHRNIDIELHESH